VTVEKARTHKQTITGLCSVNSLSPEAYHPDNHRTFIKSTLIIFIASIIL
jgi:hypothetical protein